MSEEQASYKVTGRAEVRRETRLPFASPSYQPPNGNEVRTVTQTLGLTGSMTASLLGIKSARTVRKWIGDEDPMPYAAWRLLLIHAGLALEDPDADRDDQRGLDRVE